MNSRIRALRRTGKFLLVLVLFVLSGAALIALRGTSPPRPATVSTSAPPLERRLAGAISTRYKVQKPRALVYARLFVWAGQQHGRDPVLYAAVAGAESAYRTHVVSPAGAVGLMQVMPKVHASRFLKEGLSVYTPEHNILIGTRVLEEYMAASDGNISDALQRYNGARTDRSRRYTRSVNEEYATLVALTNPRNVQGSLK